MWYVTKHQSIFNSSCLESPDLVISFSQMILNLLYKLVLVENFNTQFLEFGSTLCSLIRTKLGYWADYIDPCSGLPMLTRDCNKVYSEVDGMECLLNYRAHSAGFCKILTHPKWGSAVYPATIFVYGNRDIIVKLLHETFPTTSTT